ncbi:MAG: hypothetical protein CK546_05870 [Pedosphaera sp.]|nr:MAG: hypothetical protein CK546_05870 [Pedosphaera sp.]
MNTSPKIQDVTVGHECLTLNLAVGRTITAVLAWYPTLEAASAAERRLWRLCAAGRGVHWTALDYHLSAEGVLRGAPEGKRLLAAA